MAADLSVTERARRWARGSKKAAQSSAQGSQRLLTHRTGGQI